MNRNLLVSSLFCNKIKGRRNFVQMSHWCIHDDMNVPFMCVNKKQKLLPIALLLLVKQSIYKILLPFVQKCTDYELSILKGNHQQVSYDIYKNMVSTWFACTIVFQLEVYKYQKYINLRILNNSLSAKKHWLIDIVLEMATCYTI